MTKSSWLRDFLINAGEWFLDGFEGRFWYTFIGGLVTVVLQVMVTDQYSLASVINSLLVVLPLTYLLGEVIHGNTTPFLGIPTSITNGFIWGLIILIWVTMALVMPALTVSHGNQLLGGWFFE